MPSIVSPLRNDLEIYLTMMNLVSIFTERLSNFLDQEGQMMDIGKHICCLSFEYVLFVRVEKYEVDYH